MPLDAPVTTMTFPAMDRFRSLLGWCVVSVLRTDVEFGHARRRTDLQTDLSVLAIRAAIAGCVTDQVLTLEFLRDLVADVFQVIDAAAEGMTAGDFGQIADQGAPQIDRENLNVRLAGKFAN